MYPGQQQMGYGQPVMQQQLHPNVANAINSALPAVQQMYNCGQISMDEFNYLRNVVPQQQQQLANFIMRTYGTSNVVDPNIIYKSVYDKLLYTIQSQRRPMAMQQPMFQQQAYGYQQPAVIQQPVFQQPVFQQQGYNMPMVGNVPTNSACDMSDIYMQQHAGQLQELRTTPTPQPQQGYRSQQQPTAATLTQEQKDMLAEQQKAKYIPTNQIHDFEVLDKTILPPRKSKQLPVPEEQDAFEEYGFNVKSVDQISVDAMADIFITNVDLNEPQLDSLKEVTKSLEEIWKQFGYHICLAPTKMDLETKAANNTITEQEEDELAVVSKQMPDRNPDKFMAVVDWEDIECIEAPYEVAKDLTDQIVDTLATNKGAAVASSINALHRGGEAFLSSTSLELLSRFNEVASVNFFKTFPAVERINPFNEVKDLQALYQDSGEYTDWKMDNDAFRRSLSLCIKSSFGTIFNPNKRHYLDINKKIDFKKLMISGKLRCRINGMLSTEYITQKPVQEITEAFKKKASTIFPWIRNHRTIVHNLTLPDAVNKLQPGKVCVWPTELQGLAWYLYKKYGSVALTSWTNRLDMDHPLIIGQTYEGTLIVRRL